MNFNTTYHNTTPPYTIYNNTSIHNNSMRNLLDAGNNMDCDTSYKNNTPPYFFNPTTNTCKTTCPTPPTLFSSLPEEKLNRTIPGMVNLAPSIFVSYGFFVIYFVKDVERINIWTKRRNKPQSFGGSEYYPAVGSFPPACGSTISSYWLRYICKDRRSTLFLYLHLVSVSGFPRFARMLVASSFSNTSN